jgi:Methyltransferase domain
MDTPLTRKDIDERIARLVAERPTLHTRGDRLVDYGINPYLIAFLRRHLTAGERTIETGSGISTLIFLLMGSEHTAISPDPEEPDRIRAYCAQHGIPSDRYTPIVGGSETVLPALPRTPPFDVAFIDGNHSFPAPAIDWFYLTRVLKKNAILIVDDLQLWPCRMLADFMDEEEVWERLARSERAAAYRLLDEPEVVLGRWFGAQPYVRRRSKSWNRLRVEKQFYRLARWFGLST